MQLPSFVRGAWDSYSRRKGVDDAYHKYRALESVSAALIKYVGTTFAMIGADQKKSLEEETSERIFSSSSLGGWVGAVDSVCEHSSEFPSEVKEYCDFFSNYKKHPDRDDLDTLAATMNEIVDLLNNSGYRLERVKSPNLRRAMYRLVEFRNKCAHGFQDAPFFDSVEPHLHRVLQILSQLIPFDEFIFWGKYGNYSVRLENQTEYTNRRRDLRFWIESNLLSQGYTEKIPFLHYKEEIRSIYCLNSAVEETGADCEFIDYSTGQVIYEPVDYETIKGSTMEDRVQGLQIEKYSEHAETLKRILRWREVPVTHSTIETQIDESGVYMFISSTQLFGAQVDSVLYVGKTCSIKNRLRDYIQIKKGHDTTRNEISKMFERYASSLKLVFASVEIQELYEVERCIYEVLRPEFNIISPPEPKEE